ncbi:MAG: helix-turn-helix domain-containing protein [Oscillospiraceae bacterium]
MTEKMLTVNELAELWGVSVNLIYRLTGKKGGLKGYKVGGVIRFNPSDVEAYLAEHEIKAPEKPVAFPGMARFQYKPGMKVVSL